MNKGAVKSTSSFIGFGGGGSSESAAPEAKRLSGEVEKDLKALGKKDSTTKIKALSRLVADAREAGDDHALLLSSWSAAFLLVSQDLDWRVRLEVWRTWRSLIELVGKGKGSPLNATLRGTLGAWLSGMFDQAGEVAAAARAALPFAFDKYHAAIVHYNNDLLRDVSRQLSQTPESLAEGRSFVTEQDALQMWENLITSAVLLARHLAEELMAEEGGGAFVDLLMNKALTKHFGSKSVSVRRACLSVVAFVSNKRPGGVGPIADVAVKLCLASFDDADLTTGLETLVAVLSSDKALWEPAKLRPEKNVWPKLNAWIASGSARAAELAYVLPLLAAAPASSSLCANAAGLPKWLDALAAAFWKAAEANKVRILAAEVLSHMIDCLHLLFTRYGEQHAARVVFCALLVRALAELETLPCYREQLFEKPSFAAFHKKCVDVLWPCVDEVLQKRLPAAGDTIAAGLNSMSRAGVNVVYAPLVVRVLEACNGSAVSFALYENAGVSCSAELWDRIAATCGTDASFLVELAREGGKLDLQSVRRVMELCNERGQDLTASLIRLLKPEERVVVKSEDFDRLALQGDNAALSAVESACLTEEGIRVAASKLEWPVVCAALANQKPKVLSEEQLAAVSAAALCANAIQATQCPVPVKVLADACRSRLVKVGASAARAAAVFGEIAQVDLEVILSAWPLGTVATDDWNALSAVSPGLASLEQDDWFVAYGDGNPRTEEAGKPTQEMMFRAAVILEMLSERKLGNSDVVVEHTVFALLVGVAAGLGRSHRSVDDAGFDPSLFGPLTEAFRKAQAHSAEIMQCLPDLRVRLEPECSSGCAFLARVLISQQTFVRTVTEVPRESAGQNNLVLHVRRAAVEMQLSTDDACSHLVRLCREPFADWAAVDTVRCVASLLTHVQPPIVLSGEQCTSLAAVLSHRCWQAQLGAAYVLSRCSNGLDALLEAASDPGSDAWGCMVTWWALLGSLSREGLKQKGAAAMRLGGAPFNRFAELVFAFVDNESEALAEDAVDLASLQPHLAGDRSRLAGHLWFLAVTHLRTLARMWFTNLQDKRLLRSVQEFSAERVCAVIAASELAAAGGSEVEGLTLKASGRCVVAAVEKDDVSVELTVTLPKLFPLQSVEVAATKGNLPETLLRRWVLSLTILLMSSECSLVHALREWGRSAAQYFDGVESCHICFCVLSEAGAISKMKCANCKCSFHAECVAKWFATSHSSKCCMCQLPWRRL